jgi:hypothetical protein
VARLNPSAEHGRAFGRYGFYKSVGDTLGPLLGGAIVALGGFDLLFGVMAALGVVVAAWARLAVPQVPPLARGRQTLLDFGRRLTDRAFLRPTLALAAATGALPVGVGFLPVLGADAGPGSVLTGAVVSVLALTAAVVQPPLGFAAVAAASPEARLGQMMGSAEIGRELGDAGGRLLVAGVATAATLTVGLGALAAMIAALALLQR